jgi:hypothetical protein
MSLCRRKHDAVSHGNAVLDRKARRLERRCSIKIHNTALLHHGNGS